MERLLENLSISPEENDGLVVEGDDLKRKLRARIYVWWVDS